MNNDGLPIRALHARIEGTKSRGRQRKRWIDNVKEVVGPTREKQQRARSGGGGGSGSGGGGGGI